MNLRLRRQSSPSLLQSSSKRHSSRTAGVIGGEPEAFGFFYLVEVLAINPFDVEIGHQQMSAFDCRVLTPYQAVGATNPVKSVRVMFASINKKVFAGFR